MIHIAAFSGGKDSTALLLYLKEQGVDFSAVFCDTGWEHPLTYAYIEEIKQKVLGGNLVVLRSSTYSGMKDLVVKKRRVPSARARFCTSELKVLPMISYLKTLDDDVTVYQGIRAEESPSRAALPVAPQYSSDYDAWIARPLLRWTAAQCFDIIKKHGLEANPLYKLGAGRVGCFPCILVNQAELRRMSTMLPEVWDRVQELEVLAGRSFFPPGFIPTRFCSGYDPRSQKKFPTVADVKKYVGSVEPGILDDGPFSCMSIYNLCE